MTPGTKAQVVKRLGAGVGFDRVGITHAGRVEGGAYYREWLAAGYGGSMAYLGRHLESREEPARLLRGARSVICVALSYGREEPDAAVDAASGRPMGRVAAYARGRDYHVVMREILDRLIEALRRELDEPFEARVCVDTAPVLERALAARAGLGWIGKNTCLLSRELGSYVFLGEAITTLELAADEPVVDHCARCTRCLDACPTQALVAPHRLNAARCISYLTIEHRGEIADEFHVAMGDCVYGCDLCQEVCPYNRAAPRAANPQLLDDRTPARVDLLDTLRLTSSGYRRLTRESASRRAKRAMWRRNAAIALGNASIADPATASEVRRALAVAATDDDALVRLAAASALRRLDRPVPPTGADAGR